MSLVRADRASAIGFIFIRFKSALPTKKNFVAPNKLDTNVAPNGHWRA